MWPAIDGIRQFNPVRRYHVGMDAAQSALDSLRTVEFRETLKGYHRDDVDEYLEKAAVEAEGLQEQLRQSGERLRRAAEEISRLEAEVAAKPEVTTTPAPADGVASAASDDTLQRTLVLAQKFVDETKADAEAQAANLIADARAQASRIQVESEHRVREDIARLEATRQGLSAEVEAMTQHLGTERERLRSALTDLLGWVEGSLQADDQDTGKSSTVTNITDASRASGDVTPLRPTGSNASTSL